MSDERVAFTVLFSFLGIVFLGYAIATYVLGVRIQEHKERSITRHAARLDPLAEEANRTQPDVDLSGKRSTDSAVKVSSGIYVDRVSALSVSESSWELDFYIWFDWKGQFDDVGDDFHLIDGEIVKRDLIKSTDNGDAHYRLYRVRALITKFFDISRFPVDDHLLTIRIENRGRNLGELAFLADTDNSEVSSRVKIPGYEIYQKTLVSKLHSYRTTRGEVMAFKGDKETYSQLIYGLGIRRVGWGLYMKMFMGLFASVAISLLSFFISSPNIIAPRVTLGVGSFFASIGSSYVISRHLPWSTVFGLTELIVGASLISIFLVFITSAMAIVMYDRYGHDKLARRFDTAALALFATMYVVLVTSISRIAFL